MIKSKHINIVMIVAALYLAFFWVLNYQLGFFTLDTTQPDYVLRDASAAFVCPLISAVLIYSNVLFIRLGSESLARISIINTERDCAKAQRRFTQFLLRFQLLSFGLTLFISFCIAVLYLHFSGFWIANPEQEFRWVLLAQIFPFWIMLVMLVLTIYKVQLSLRLLLAKFARISLFESEKLKPISDFLFASFFAYCFHMLLYLLVTLFVDLLWLDIVILGIISGITFLVQIAPLNMMQTKIRVQKERTINAINKLLSEQLTQQQRDQNVHDNAPHRRLVDDSNRLEHTSDLLLVRQEIKTISTLPVTVPTMMKLLFILMIPFFSWVGAGVVSQLLKVLM